MFSKLLLLIIFFCICFLSTFAQPQRLVGPTLKIDLLGTSIKERSDYFLIELKLRQTYTNNTDRKILLLDKYSWRWRQDIYLKNTDGELSLRYTIGDGRSYFNRDTERKDLLAIELPSEKVEEIDPGKSLEVEDATNVIVFKNRSWDNGGLGQKEIMTDDLKHMSSVWLSLGYIYWDWNLDLDLKTMKKLNFADQLRKKWSNYGLLWTEPMKSNLIEIRLPKFQD